VQPALADCHHVSSFCQRWYRADLSHAWDLAKFNSQTKPWGSVAEH